MNLDELSANLHNLENELQRMIPVFTQQMGLNLVALVKKRITGQGTDKDGKAFPYPYSRQYQRLKSGLVNHSKGGKKIIGEGRDVGFRNHYLSGSMMNAFKEFKEGDRYFIGFQSQKEKDKAEGNSFGHKGWQGMGENIIEPSKTELEGELVRFENKIVELFKKYL